MPLSYDPDYPVVNIGAHRKAAPLAGIPGLTQHFSFWRPPAAPRQSWHKSIDYFLFLIFMCLWEEFSIARQTNSEAFPVGTFRCPNLDRGNHRLYLCRHNAPINFANGEVADSYNGSPRMLSETNEKERSVRYEFFSIRTIFQGIDLTVRAELRSEFWSLTFLGDLSRFPRSLPASDHYANFSDAFSKIGDFFEGRIKENAESVSSKVDDDTLRQLSNCGNLLHDEFNQLINTKLIDKCTNGFPNADDVALKNIGGVFADFRGVVFGIDAQYQDDSESKSSGVTLGSRKNCKFSFIRSPQSASSSIHALHSITKFAQFTDDIGLRVVDALWPAVRAFYDRPDDKLKAYGKPEFTVTAFQNRRAIYITSLGRLTPDARSRTNDPVRYTVVTAPSTRWQLGRLIERIHNMGALRLAAIQEIASLQAASDNLREIYDDWQKLKLKPPSDPSRADELIDAGGFAARLEKLGSDLSSGLTYRIERSAYYVIAFKKVLAGLRTKRLEGFQPYPDFVERRMGGTFEFIARIGIRYVEMRREIELALERQRTQQMMGLQSAGIELVRRITHIETDISATTNALNRNQGKTNRLLKRAELFLAIGIIYYGSGILWGICKSFVHEFDLTGRIGDPEEFWFYPFVALCVFAVFWLLRERDAA
jgi:Protein of unknown function (DUF3422)